MATCKDCVHVDVCEDITRHKLSPSRAEKILPILREHGKTCELFKDRSRFVELPCTVYYFNTAGKIFSQKVSGFIVNVNYVGILADSDLIFDSHLMGDRFFSTREEAEQALKLKERENDA